jgi:hypothetical protein
MGYDMLDLRQLRLFTVCQEKFWGRKMVSGSMTAKTFTVHIEERSGLFFGTSPEIKGLFIAKRSPQEVEDAVPSTVQDLYAAREVYVIVSKLEDADKDVSWVTIPAEIARKGLERVAR